MKPIAILLSLLMLIASCEIKKQTDTETDSEPVNSLTLQNVSPSIVKADSMYVCSLNMFERIHSEKDENVVFSPLGIETLFRMLQDGATGNTANELQQVLGVSSEEISGIIHDLQNNGGERNSDVHWTDVRMANLVAVNEKYKLHNAYRDKVRSRYDAEVMHLNFDKPQSAADINDWVKEHTNGIYKSIMEKTSSDTYMYAVNALYFKGTWVHLFEKESTKEKAFHQYDGKKTTVAMMWHQDKYSYSHNDTMQVVSIPYIPRCTNNERHKNFSMYVMLPRKGKTIDDALAYMHRHDIADIKKSMCNLKVNLQIPRFTIETQTDVLSVLRSLGAQHFDEFAGISPDKIMISEAMQRSKIDVDEYSTEAVAVTSAELETASERKEEIYSFVANRPFIYMIIDNVTNTIYFMGKYTQGTINDGEVWVSREYTGEKKKEPASYNSLGNVIIPREPMATEPIIPKIKDGVYDVAEQMPSFPGGQAKLMEFIEKNMHYPQLAREKQIQGRVVLQFIVSENGKISDIKVANKVDPLLEKEAVRIIKCMPRWNPGRQAGQPVKVRYTLPITFRLN